MKLHIPPSQALVIFEALARHLNITRASEELCLTPSAISKQLKSLEEFIGIELFQRTKNGLVITTRGSSYLKEIKPALVQLSKAGSAVNAHSIGEEPLRIKVLPSVAERWLLARMLDFNQRYPAIEIQFNTGTHPDQAFPFTFDAYICSGDGDWKYCISQYICGKEMVLAASPILFERFPPLTRLEDLPNYPLLEHNDNPFAWGTILKRGKPDRTSDRPRIRWDFYSVLIKSACTGLGIGLIPRALVQDELERGELIQLLDCSYTSKRGYYFVCSETRQHHPAIVAFRDWLKDRQGEGETHLDPALGGTGARA